MGAENKPAAGGRDKKDDGKSSGSAVSVFKVAMYCDSCAKEFKRAVEHMDGVEKVEVDLSANKLTVTGKVDAAKIKARLEEIKPKRKVEIVSQPKKHAATKIKARPEEKTKKKVHFVTQPKNDGGGGGAKKGFEEKKPPKEKNKKKVDKAKELVAVTGTMDVQELMWRRYLQDMLWGSKDVVPTNKKDKATNIYIFGDVNIKIGK